MKKSLLATVLLFCSCSSVDDFKHFAQPIQYIDDQAPVAEITLTPIGSFDTPLLGIAVYDSLLVVLTPQEQTLFAVYNLRCKKQIGRFGLKGRGPQEAIAVMPIRQFYTQCGTLKADLIAFNESKLLQWNLSESITQGRTIIDTVFDYTMDHTEDVLRWRFNYTIGSDSLLAYNSNSHGAQTHANDVPQYELRRKSSGALLQTYRPYLTPLKSGSRENFTSVSYLLSEDCIKPDLTRIAMGMAYFPQLNILDVTTGACSSYRLKSAPEFSPEIKRWYFSATQATDSHIYALYCGEELDNGTPFNGCQWIYVFDWDGALVDRWRLDHQVTDLFLDASKNRLYLYSQKSEELFFFDV